MIQFKPEVRIAYFSARLGEVLAAASVWSLLHSVDIEINSINDGREAHIRTSLHAYDLAIDLDTVGDRPPDLALLANHLRRWLDPQYDVVFEADHIHVEWDARRGASPAGA